jgi:hypothetical protein
MTEQAQIDAFRGMIQQENTTYQVGHSKTFATPPLDSTTICDLFQPVDSIDCRYNLVDWCYRMIDFCHLNRETVAIAMNFVDRFVTSEKGTTYLSNSTLYQLVAMTALFTAIKVHEIQAIDLQSLSNISKGTYSLKQIEEVERILIDALHWRMNPPTAMSFVRCFVEAISPHFQLSAQAKEKILYLSRVQTEYAVFDHDLIENKMSTIGFCSLLNALPVVLKYQVTMKQLEDVLSQKFECQICDVNEVALLQPKLHQLLCNHRNIHPVNGSTNLSMAAPLPSDSDVMLSHTKESPRSIIHKGQKF